ncbi:hydroxyethylthiazole kinase [Georgenia deserti]|uniref:Hydroxyethylthiazole kinase n=1 Tax=Georgenia deserti TaxID=2093781 RepID=A0ABW4L4L8_9MICO
MSAPSTPVDTVDPGGLAAALSALREGAPLVQCLTNVVVAQWTANTLLAAGASPVMVDNPQEARACAGVAGGVLVNVGTPQEETAAAMTEAVAGAAEAGTPWVLDPVGAGALAWRTRIAHDLLGRHAPAVIRGNASEILALDGGTGGKGVEGVDAAEDAMPAATALAHELGCVVAVSGRVDHVTDGERVVRVSNGSPLLTKVTGAGCALGALMAGFTAVVADRLVAATAATAVFTLAAEAAQRAARGPGSFAVALLDELDRLQPAAVADGVRLS